MFTGLIESIGVIRGKRPQDGGLSFQVECHFDSGDYIQGESIAVDGVCVTVETFDANGFTFSTSAETLQRSTIREKKTGDKVHLERALRLGDRMGGHIVQGHVDGVGDVRQLVSKGSGAELRINIPESLSRYVVEKGSVAVDGVSLTVASLNGADMILALIPATLEVTYLGELKAGDKVNLEVDILSKYVESILKPQNGIDEEKLKQWGF
jgi:riboflavin synthase